MDRYITILQYLNYLIQRFVYYSTLHTSIVSRYLNYSGNSCVTPLFQSGNDNNKLHKMAKNLKRDRKHKFESTSIVKEIIVPAINIINKLIN